ncbi:CPBP family intramembrane glutamic endopeptidase [Kribbella sp. DT2]|uniref:CPBP family intramembrane glutamic endopeptidase n=1 Tax=Kribbella sp. DT2 TaxID=3393427 RepID=UPI003CED19F9
MTTTVRRRADLPAYLLIAFSGMWLAMLPLLITGYHRDSNEPGMGALQQICVYAAMTSPALAALFVLRYVARVPDLRAALGLVLPRPWRKGLADCLLALFVPLALTVAALCVGAAFGVYAFDLRDLSGFRAEFAPDAGGNGIPWSTVAGWAVVLILQMLVSLPFFYGEELGWQGYLLPRLMPYGRLIGYAGTALVFALWHLPTLIMGGQYPGYSLLASVGALVVSCLLVVPIFSWLRLRSNSVLPAVLAHTVVSSATVRTAWLLSDSDVEMDPMSIGLQAWPGWIVMGLFVVWLVRTRRI